MITLAEVARFLRILRRWWLLILSVSVVAVGSTLAIAIAQPPTYRADAYLLVGDGFTAPSADPNDLEVSKRQAIFYSDLAYRRSVLEPVVEQLGLKLDWAFIAEQMLTVVANPESNLLEIRVVDTDPERAAALANGIAAQLLTLSPLPPEDMMAERQAIEDQIRILQASIDQATRRLTVLQEQLEDAQASARTAIQQDILLLETSRTRDQDALARTFSLRSSWSTSSLTVFDTARVPTEPLLSTLVLQVAIALVASLGLSIITVLFLDWLLGRWSNAGDLQQRTGLATLGRVPGGGPAAILSGPLAAEYSQALTQTFVNLTALERRHNLELPVIQFSSHQAKQSRQALVVDLAHLYSEAGRRVAVVSADGHDEQLSARLQQAAGGTPSEARVAVHKLEGGTGRSRTLALAGLEALLTKLKAETDVVLIDSPALSDVPEAALVAPYTDGLVLALDPSSDSAHAISSYAELFRAQGGRIFGAVLVQELKGAKRPNASVSATNLPAAPKARSS